jgi:indole-3-glycerol phosphate synthase
MPKTILDKIMADKKREVERLKRQAPLASLKARAAQCKPLDFKAALSGKGLKLIAEIKKASPSKGLLCPDFRPVAMAQIYEQSGAAAISVLTEANYFQGSLEHLSAIREKVNLPLLRKDFIFDEYQIYESAVYGADALLLIAAILSPKQMANLLELSHSLGLACLVEVHDENEVEKALKSGAEIIGINNRDLRTFKTDIETTHRLRTLVPPNKIVVSESGIHNRNDMKTLKAWDVNAALIGEALVTSKDIAAAIKELMYDQS